MYLDQSDRPEKKNVGALEKYGAFLIKPYHYKHICFDNPTELLNPNSKGLVTCLLWRKNQKESICLSLHRNMLWVLIRST